MLPIYEQSQLQEDFTMGGEAPSLTWEIKDNRIAGLCDGAMALRQAVALMLCTERFAHAIYSHNYGVELKPLYGLSPALAYARLQSCIEEALLVDDRIQGVMDFTFMPQRDGITVGFTIKSTLGEVAVTQWLKATRQF